MHVRDLLVGASVTATVAAGLSIAVAPSASADPTLTLTITAQRVGASVHVSGMLSTRAANNVFIPMIKLPGASTYTAGVARPSQTCGSFTWNRHIRAGRTISFYFTDGAVESNVVEITPTTVGVGVRSRDRVPRC